MPYLSTGIKTEPMQCGLTSEGAWLGHAVSSITTVTELSLIHVDLKKKMNSNNKYNNKIFATISNFIVYSHLIENTKLQDLMKAPKEFLQVATNIVMKLLSNTLNIALY